MDSSDEDEDSDVFYSCDSDYVMTNGSPLRANILGKSADNLPQELKQADEQGLVQTESFDPVSLNILRKLSIGGNSQPNTPIRNESSKVRFAESHITYNIIEEESHEEAGSEEEGDEGKENRKVGVELKKVFTKIITKAEEVQKTVGQKFERKKDKEVPPEQSRPTQSPAKWLKDLIGPNRPPPSQLAKNSVATFARRKTKREFGSLVCVQTIDMHEGAIWAMKFSFDGTLMASGGQDGLLRLWKINTDRLFTSQAEFAYFQRPPAYIFQGHNGDILDLSWSKGNKRILSASMDRTVKLWQLDKDECVHSQTIDTDIVTSVIFHPTDDNLFLSGSLDNKLMLWNIEQKAAIHTVDTHEFITTVSFTLNGKLAIAGLHSGMCTFFSVEGLVPKGKIYVHSSRGKNKKGKKISGIEALPDGKNILITSNDSRIRLYRLDDFTCECKYKGLVNNSFQIKATSNVNGNYIICGSEDNMVYIWNTQNDCTMFSPADNIPIIGAGSRRDINSSYECFPANSQQSVAVTVAIFAPHMPPPSMLSTPHLSIDEKQPAQSTTPPLATPLPEDVSTVKKTSTSSSSPPLKTLAHRNSISSIINLITPGSKGTNHKSSTPPNAHHINHNNHPQSQSHLSHSAPPTPQPNHKTSPDGATSAESSPNPSLSSSPPPSGAKKGIKPQREMTLSGMELLADDQLVYIVTADASGQIKVFENFPILSPSTSPPSIPLHLISNTSSNSPSNPSNSSPNISTNSSTNTSNTTSNTPVNASPNISNNTNTPSTQT